MTPDGGCPSCGRRISRAAPEPSAPWHFKVLVVATTVYVGWRLVQIAARVVG